SSRTSTRTSSAPADTWTMVALCVPVGVGPGAPPWRASAKPIERWPSEIPVRPLSSALSQTTWLPHGPLCPIRHSDRIFIPNIDVNEWFEGAPITGPRVVDQYSTLLLLLEIEDAIALGYHVDACGHCSHATGKR